MYACKSQLDLKLKRLCDEQIRTLLFITLHGKKKWFFDFDEITMNVYMKNLPHIRKSTLQFRKEPSSLQKEPLIGSISWS